MNQFRINDNNGNIGASGCVCADPIAASGITLATGTAGSDVTQTVIGGAIYAITAIGANFLFSITGVTSSAANREWIAASGSTIVIKIPEGKTTLYFEGDANTTYAYMRRLA